MNICQTSAIAACLFLGIATGSFGQYGQGYQQPYQGGATCLPNYPNGYGQNYPNGYGQTYPNRYGQNYPNSYGGYNQPYPNGYSQVPGNYNGYTQFGQPYPVQPQVVVVPPRVIISPPPVVYAPPTVVVRPPMNYGYGHHGGGNRGGYGGRQW